MNVLVLKPGSRHLGYALYSVGKAATVMTGEVRDYRRGGEDQQVMGEAMAELWEKATHRGAVLSLAVEVTSGGSEFGPCVLADEAVLEQLSSQAGQAPLHLPVVISLVRACQHVLPQMPVILTFQSAFFADLPARERSYGLDPDMAARLGLQRTGQYGLYHAAACSHLVHLHKDEAKPPRIISICLDHQNELAAVLGRRPLLVTSGATTLEGLPGLTTTGEMDPSITLTLARELKWGPEQINRVLTQESGLRGLAGEPVTTLALFRSRANSSKLARDVMQYRLLLACGSAIAAMGGVDEIIFTGRYAEAGNRLGPWLCERLTRSRGMGNVSWRLCAQSLEQIVAELTVTTLAVSTDQAA